MRTKLKWSYSHLRLRLHCGLHAYYRLVSLRNRSSEEKKARHHKKIGRPRIWTLRQAASAVNVWGIAYRHFPRQDRYRDDESYPNSGWPVGGSDLVQRTRLLPGELQIASLVNAAADIKATNAPICITDPEVEMLSNRQ